MLEKLKNNFTFPFLLLNICSIIVMVWQIFESMENFYIILFTYLTILIVWFFKSIK